MSRGPTRRAQQRALLEPLLRATSLTQAALAARLDVDGSTLRRWLSGARPLEGPTRVLVELLAADPALVARLPERR